MPAYGHIPLRAPWTDDVELGGAIPALFRMADAMARIGLTDDMLSHGTQDALRELRNAAVWAVAAASEVYAPAKLNARLLYQHRGRVPEASLAAAESSSGGLTFDWEPLDGDDVFEDRAWGASKRIDARLAELKYFGNVTGKARYSSPGKCSAEDEACAKSHLAVAAVRLFHDVRIALEAGCKVKAGTAPHVSVDEETGVLLEFGLTEPAPGEEAEGPSPGA